MPIRVLFVCTGNVCRSPAAELLARRAFAEAGIDASVSSAGVRALVGKPVHEAVAQALDGRGVAGEHVARDIDPDLVTAADLIVTMTRAQRSEVVQIDPRAWTKTFTLRELARVGEQVGPAVDGLAPWLTEVVRHRGVVPGEDDIEDPLVNAAVAFSDMVDLIEAEVSRVVALLPAESATPGAGGPGRA